MVGLLQNMLKDEVTGRVTSFGNNLATRMGLGEHQLSMIAEVDKNFQATDSNSVEGMIENGANLLINNSPLGVLTGATSQATHASYMHTEAIAHIDDRGIAGFESDSITIDGHTFHIHADASGLAYGQSADLITQGSIGKLDFDQKQELNDFRFGVERQAKAEMQGFIKDEASAAEYRNGLEHYVENQLGAEYAAKNQGASLDMSHTEPANDTTTNANPMASSIGDQVLVQLAKADIDIADTAMPDAAVINSPEVSAAPQTFSV